jgi:hypothetical protein
MSLSSKSSRASSLSNIFRLGDNQRSNPIEAEAIELAPDTFVPLNGNASNMNNRRNSHSSDSDDDDGSDDYMPSRHMTITQNHPMGRILLGFLNEHMKTAKKNNSKAIDINIENLCSDFCEFLKLMSSSNARSTATLMAGIELKLLNKELNSHTINMSIEPPTFTSAPAIRSVHDKAEAMKIFPTRHKFNGSTQDNHMDVVEYLGALNDAQEHCNLNEKEFKGMLMATSTGKPHALLRGWIANNEDIPTIYHNLLLHFDKRISPEDARRQLNEYKAPKSAKLATIEAHLMDLADRAATMLPAGPSRVAFYNMELINALIRCLPPQSSSIVQMKYNELSARLGRAATAAELSRAIHSARYAIDIDIRDHGSERSTPSHKVRLDNKGENFIRGTQKYKTSYEISGAEGSLIPDHDSHFAPRDTMSQPFRSGMKNTPDGMDSLNPAPSRPNYFQSSPYNSSHRSRSGKTPSRNPGRFQKPYNSGFSPRYCSLCGKKDHTAAQECPYMVNDHGETVNVLPTLGTCQACPPEVSPRLNHPAPLCPYREGGPF